MKSRSVAEQLAKLTHSKRKIMGLLSNLGYDISKEEGKVFVDVVEDALIYLEKGFTIEEVYMLLQAKKTSPLYVELAYFDYERGMDFIHDSLKSFQETRGNADKKIAKEVFKTHNNALDPYNSAFCIVNYLNENKKNEVPAQKVKVRN